MDAREQMDHIEQARRLRKLLRLCRKHIGDASVFQATGGEADSVLLAVMEMAHAHASAVQALAEKHYAHGWSALCSARACFEAGAVSTWIGRPNEPFEREGRWIGFFRKLGRFYESQGELLDAVTPGIKDELRNAFEQRYAVFKMVTKMHPQIRIVEAPAIRVVLKDSGYEHLYAVYKEACEIVHSGPEAIIRTRRQAPGSHNRRTFLYKCEATPWLWTNAVRMSGWGATASTYMALLRNGRDPASLEALIKEHKEFNLVVEPKAE